MPACASASSRRKMVRLLGVVGLGRIAGRRADAAIVLRDQLLAGELLLRRVAPQLAAHALVHALGEGLGQAVGQRLQHDAAVVVGLVDVARRAPRPRRCRPSRRTRRRSRRARSPWAPRNRRAPCWRGRAGSRAPSAGAACAASPAGACALVVGDRARCRRPPHWPARSRPRRWRSATSPPPCASACACASSNSFLASGPTTLSSKMRGYLPASSQVWKNGVQSM